MCGESRSACHATASCSWVVCRSLRLGRDTSTCGAGIILDFGDFAKLVQEVDVWRIPERLPCRRATATCKRWPGESRDGSLLSGGPIPVHRGRSVNESRDND